MLLQSASHVNFICQFHYCQNVTTRPHCLSKRSTIHEKQTLSSLELVICTDLFGVDMHKIQSRQWCMQAKHSLDCTLIASFFSFQEFRGLEFSSHMSSSGSFQKPLKQLPPVRFSEQIQSIKGYCSTGDL